MIDYVDRVARDVVIYDGGTGTSFQAAGLTADDFGGPDLEGCNEMLNLLRTDVVSDLHRSFFDVGAWTQKSSGWRRFYPRL